LIRACREGRELAHRSLRPPAVQSARRAPAHYPATFTQNKEARSALRHIYSLFNILSSLFFLFQQRMSESKRQLCGWILGLIFWGGKRREQAPPCGKTYNPQGIADRICRRAASQALRGLAARRLRRHACGAPSPLTSFAESSAQSARSPLRRLGADLRFRAGNRAT